MKPLQSLSTVIILAVLLVSFTVFYTVPEGSRAILVRLGKVVDGRDVKPKVAQPGLHVKFPLIDQVKRIDVRIQGLSSKPFSVLTAQQTYLSVSHYIKWRITDLALFYKRNNKGDFQRAEQLLEQNINTIIRAEFGSHTSNEAISSERDKIMTDIKNKANGVREIKDIGVEIVDVRLQSIVLPERVLKSVFSRMASERKQFAENARAEGNRIAEGIRALADQKVVIIKASAKASAAKIRAQGDQEAAEIYAKTYGEDPEFYQFYRSLQAYQSSFSNKHDILILQPDNQFFNYFNKAKVELK